MASNLNNNFTDPWLQSPRIPRSRGYDCTPNHPYDNHDPTELPVFYRSRSSQVPTADTTEGGAIDHFWGLIDEYGLAPRIHTISGTLPNRGGTRGVTVNNGRVRGSNLSRRRQASMDHSTPRIISQTSFQFPRFIGQTSFQFSTPEDAPSLTQDEQDEALRKLKKQTYRPAGPGSKTLSKKPSSYHRNNEKNEEKATMEKGNEDGKSCAICLEDFKNGEQVVVTPCKHMFHEDCVVPWVKSHGQCPVCRLAIYQTARDQNSTTSSNIFNDDDNVLYSLRRAMDEVYV